MKHSRITCIMFVLIAASILSSCSLFRKKNRCNTCPTWDDRIELSERGKGFEGSITSEGFCVNEEQYQP